MTRFISPNSLCNPSVRRLRCRRGKNLARLTGELLEAFLKTLRPPFTGFAHHFAFDVGKPGYGFEVLVHGMTRFFWFSFHRREEPLPAHPTAARSLPSISENSAWMRPGPNRAIYFY